MAIFGFWIIVVALWLFFRLVSRGQRRELVRGFWTVILLTGAAGALFSALA